MLAYVSAVFILCLLGSVNAKVLPSNEVLPNILYGPDPQQVMDVYLPGGRDPTVSKVILLIHGGGWAGGRREDMDEYVDWFLTNFPRHVIVNMGYRLATISSPALPKQVDDIASVIKYMTDRQDEFKIRPEFDLVGFSAGAHLALLYSYAFDKSQQVNVICNIVGPTDFVDPEMRAHPIAPELTKYLIGNYTYEEHPEKFAAASPVKQITRQSPKTISFYGGKDPLIPISQGINLEEKLDSTGIYNKYYLYPNEGHKFTDPAIIAHVYNKTKLFFQSYH